MKKKWFKIKVWKRGDYDLLQECDRELTDVQVKNFKVDKQHRGTIGEIKKQVKRTTSKTTKGTDNKSR